MAESLIDGASTGATQPDSRATRPRRVPSAANVRGPRGPGRGILPGASRNIAATGVRPTIANSGAKGFAAQGGIAKLSVVGIGMRSHSGVAAKMFEVLGKAGINIQMITTSEIKISVIVDEASVDEGANVVHAGFGLGPA